MNLYEKLNRLDDSLVESKRVIKKKKLTESVEDVARRKEFLKSVFTKWEILDLAEAHNDFTGRTYEEAFDYVLNNWDNFYFEDEYEAFCEDEYDDDIDEMLTESVEQYELSTLVKDSISHLVNNLGKDPMADDFGDDVCADLEDNYDIYVPENPVKYADWCDAVMSEVSRQLNNKDEQLTEAASKHVLPDAAWAVEVDGDMLGTDYEDRDEAIESLNEFLEENNMDPEEVEYYVYQDFRSLNQNELSAYLADIFEETYKTKYKYYKRFVEDIVRFIKDHYNFPKYQMQTIEKDAYNIAYVMTEILEDKFA